MHGLGLRPSLVGQVLRTSLPSAFGRALWLRHPGAAHQLLQCRHRRCLRLSSFGRASAFGRDLTSLCSRTSVRAPLTASASPVRRARWALGGAPLYSADIGRLALHNGVRDFQYDLILLTLIYAHDVLTRACRAMLTLAPSFAIRGKTCGPKRRRPTFCWGARIRALGRVFTLPHKENFGKN